MGALRRLFAWRVDPEPSARVPLAASLDALPREPAIQREGRPGEAMAGMYCGRCGRPNPERARYCSNCGAPLIRNTNTGSFTAIPGERGNETTSILTNDVPESYEEPSADYAAPDTLPPGTALLIVLRGPNAGSRFLLDHDFTSAGRHPDSDIFLDDVTVSRRHAEFYRHGDRFTVRDVGSLNGTYVNRDRIEEADLFGGDEVQIGKFRLLFMAHSPEVGRRGGLGAQDYV
jgi:pSer/pThr/pTyr-binding forkhead associated (FHA) protein